MSSQEIIIEKGVLKGAILHSLWLRERLSGDKFVDPNNLQRLYEPSLLDENLLIDSYSIKDNFYINDIGWKVIKKNENN